MYSVMPKELKNIDLDSLHPKLVAGLYPKLWRAFIKHELIVSNEEATDANITKFEAQFFKNMSNKEELNKTYLTYTFLDKTHQVLPVVMPSFSRTDSGDRKWNAYYQMAAADVNNPTTETMKDVRIGVGVYDSRREAENAAIYKCFEIIEERL